MAEFDYKRYLASREWALKKEALRKRSNGYCERCGVAEYQSTHHLTYQNIGHEPLEDLLAVCNECHEFLSAKSDYDPGSSSNVFLFLLAISDKNFDMRAWTDGVPFCGGRIVGALTQKDGIGFDVVWIPAWIVTELGKRVHADWNMRLGIDTASTSGWSEGLLS